MPDSIAHITPTDSTAAYYAPQWSDGFPQPEAGDSVVPHSLTTLPLLEMPQGQTAIPSPQPLLRDSGTMAMLLAVLFLVVVCHRTGHKYLEQMAHNLFSARRRENAFEDHTINETQILTALTLCTCVMEGIVGFVALDHYVPALRQSLHASVTLHTALLTGIVLTFYLVQLAVYNLVGQVFADDISTRLWKEGFNASHSLLGLLLIPIVALLLAFSTLTHVLLLAAIVVYIGCRLVFIYKGFRIFFNSFGSLVYFILYLCSVEVVPLVLLSAGTIYLCTVI